MFFPYADDTESYSVPWWVIGFISLNVIAFILSMTGGEGYFQNLWTYGAIPSRFFGSVTELPDLGGSGTEEIVFTLSRINSVPPLLTLLTSMFMHGGFFHLAGNMWFMWLFADNVEDRMGKIYFPIFYILCGLAAGLCHILLYQSSTVPVVGASGAIAGVMGAYIYMFPSATIATFTRYFYYWHILHIPATIYLGLWFLLQLFGGFALGAVSNVAFAAHIGGFLAGLLLAWIMSKANMITWYDRDRGYIGGVTYRRIKTPPPSKKKKFIWRE